MRLGRYTLEEKIGSGGYGEVWRGWLEGDLGFRKPVAVKLLRGLGAEVERSLVNEGMIGARLRHPNVVDVIELTRVDGRWLLAMELVEGRTLEALIADHPDGLPPDAVSSIVRQVAAGLAHAHELLDDDGRPLGLVHRDLKPANVMVSRSGQVKILDFGLAVFRNAVRSTLPGTIRGTPRYLAPEQVEIGAIGPATDVWALGAITVLLATGEALIPDGPPLVVATRVLRVDAAEAAARVAEKAPALAGLIERCLRRDPAQRPTAAEITRELGASAPIVLADSGDPPSRASSSETWELDAADLPPPEAPVPPTRRAWLFGATALVAGLGGVGLGSLAARRAGSRRGGVLRVAMPRERGTLDPWQRTRTLAQAVLPLVLEPLATVDADGAVSPGALGSWAAHDGDTRFRLRPRAGQRFHDHPCVGAPAEVTAEDLRFAIRTALDLGFLQLPVRDLAVVDGEVELRTEEPCPFLPALLAPVPLLPAALAACESIRDLTRPVGTGPFRFDADASEAAFRLVRHDGWRDGARPWLDGVVIRTVIDDAEAVALVASGALDLAELRDPSSADADGRALRPELARPGVRLVREPVGGLGAIKGLLVFRNGPNPPLEPASRRALSAALPRGLVDAVRTRNAVEPSDRLLRPNWLGHDPALRPPQPDPPALSALGPLVLGAFEGDLAWAEALGAALRAEGREVRVVTLALPSLERATTPGERSPVDLALVELHGEVWGGSDPWPLLSKLVPALGEVSFVGPATRAAAVRVRTERDHRARADAHAALERALLEEMPFVPLGWLKGTSGGRLLAVSERVQGLADERGTTFGDPWRALPDLWLT